MKYIHTIEFKEEDYEEAVATTPEEIRQLGSRLGKILRNDHQGNSNALLPQAKTLRWAEIISSIK
jgi:hypothetical protein